MCDTVTVAQSTKLKCHLVCNTESNWATIIISLNLYFPPWSEKILWLSIYCQSAVRFMNIYYFSRMNCLLSTVSVLNETLYTINKLISSEPLIKHRRYSVTARTENWFSNIENYIYYLLTRGQGVWLGNWYYYYQQSLHGTNHFESYQKCISQSLLQFNSFYFWKISILCSCGCFHYHQHFSWIFLRVI